jgi:MFS family permease
MRIEQKYIPAVASIGQVMEILTMFILPFFIKRLGFKITIAIGIVAWGLRFLIFAIGEPTALVIAAQALHGVCFAFAIAASMIYVDKISTPDIKGSMQSFLAFITYGVGMFVGSIIAAKVFAFSSKPIPNSTDTAVNWLYIWIVPAAGCAVALVLFLIGFKAKDKPADVTLGEEAKDAPPGNI